MKNEYQSIYFKNCALDAFDDRWSLIIFRDLVFYEKNTFGELLKSPERISINNSCLLNLYHDGNEGIAWHSEAERDLKREGAISSLSFGAERKCSFKHKQSKQVVSKILQNGSLLVMKDTTQTCWLRRLPPTKTVSTPRINLTFRTIV